MIGYGHNIFTGLQPLQRLYATFCSFFVIFHFSNVSHSDLLSFSALVFQRKFNKLGVIMKFGLYAGICL